MQYGRRQWAGCWTMSVKGITPIDDIQHPQAAESLLFEPLSSNLVLLDQIRVDLVSIRMNDSCTMSWS